VESDNVDLATAMENVDIGVFRMLWKATT